jgi:hypothetical protein
MSGAVEGGMVRKDWEISRAHRVYPLINKELNRRRQDSGEGFESTAEWLADAIGELETVSGELRTAGIDNVAGYDINLENGRLDTYSILAGLAWSSFIRQRTKSYMRTYDYDGFHATLEGLRSRMRDSGREDIFGKFELDISRAAASAMLRQEVITRAGNDTFYAAIGGPIAKRILETSLRPEDGMVTDQEEFDNLSRRHLGMGIGSKKPNFQPLARVARTGNTFLVYGEGS